jgi:hypothetical protein
VDVVWAWGDLMNALQVFPNLVGVLGPERHGDEGGVVESAPVEGDASDSSRAISSARMAGW